MTQPPRRGINQVYGHNRDNAHRIPWIPPAGDGSRYDHMMESIDPTARKTKEYIRAARDKKESPTATVVDCKLVKPSFACGLSEEQKRCALRPGRG